MPFEQAEDRVRVSYAGRTLTLRLGYSRSRFALPVWLAWIGAAAESTLLVLLCLSLVPILAVLLALVIFLVSEESVPATWAVGLLILALGYGALALALLAAGTQVPDPRRAIFRTRAAVQSLRTLPRGGPPTR